MSDRTQIDLALEREAQLTDQRTELGALWERQAVPEEEYQEKMDTIRSELATVRARISRLLQRGALPSPEAPEIVEFPLAVGVPEP